MKHLLEILEFVKPYKWMISISLVLSFLYVILNTMSLWMISSLISSILNPNALVEKSSSIFLQNLELYTSMLIGEGNQFHKLKMLCILIFLSFLFKNIFLYISEIMLSYVNNKMIMNIRIKIFNHLQFLPLSYFNNAKTGEISTIILTDAARMRVAVIDVFRKLSKHPLNIIFLIVMLFLINAKMTIIALILFPIVAIVVTFIGKSIRRKTKRSSKSIAGIVSMINENIQGVQIIKSFLHEKIQINRFLKESKKFFNLDYKLDRLTLVTTPINDMIGVTMGVILLWVGGNEVFNNSSMNPDDFIKFIIFLFAMMQPAKSLAGINISIQKSIASAERVFELLDIEKEDNKSQKEKQSFDSVIEIKNLSFSYNKSSLANTLKNISFRINKGETVAIVGKSGSGKSTLINMLPRFYNPTKGAILFDGEDSVNLSLESLRGLISIVSQDSFLFNDTIKNNIHFGSPSTNDEQIIEAAKKANALNFINEFPNGFNTVIGERGVKISGGQKQRISIARTILKDSPIIIFDEATASLDSESEKKVHMAIKNLLQNKTVIIIAHRLSTVINADNIIVLDEGQIVEEGTHSELIENNAHYKYLYDLQFDDLNEDK